MKRILLTLLGAVIVIGALAGAGFAGYRIGFSQGVRTSANGDASPFVGRPEFNLERPPFPLERGFDRGFNRDFPRRIIRNPPGGGGFGSFGPLMFLGHIAIWGLILLLIYLLFTRSGWTITRTQQTVQSSSANTETELEPQEREPKNE